MTREQAKAARHMFLALGFAGTKTEEFGWESGVYHVHIWTTDLRTSERNLYTVTTPVADEAAAKKIAKAVKAAAKKSSTSTGRHQAALVSLDAE